MNLEQIEFFSSEIEYFEIFIKKIGPKTVFSLHFRSDFGQVYVLGCGKARTLTTPTSNFQGKQKTKNVFRVWSFPRNRETNLVRNLLSQQKTWHTVELRTDERLGVGGWASILFSDAPFLSENWKSENHENQYFKFWFIYFTFEVSVSSVEFLAARNGVVTASSDFRKLTLCKMSKISCRFRKNENTNLKKKVVVE